jgi:arabinose-5-phosphate isomerase
MRDAIVMIAKRRGIAVMLDDKGKIDGILTAGDLSRLLEHSENVFTLDVASVMTRNPRVAKLGELASAVVYRMEEKGIMVMPVVDARDTFAGVVHLHDLMRARVG